MAETSIEWATHVLNAFTGCDKVSPGCARCYAVAQSKRRKAMELGRARVAAEQGKPLPVMRYQNDGDPRTSGPGFGFTVHWDKLEKPERFPAGARVFVNSMSDVFHEEAPEEAIAALWAVFAEQPDVDFLVLTKRPERMLEVLKQSPWFALSYIAARSRRGSWAIGNASWPLRNVWLGVTIENRRFVQRADLLRETPAAVRFISAEPLLGPLVSRVPCPSACWVGDPDCICDAEGGVRTIAGGEPWSIDLTSIDWLIAGGESGKGARPIREEWLRDLRDACAASGTAFFLKQLGVVLARERGLKGKGGGGQATLDGELHHAMPGGA